MLKHCFLCLLVGACLNRSGDNPGKLYFEPPARLIDDYRGMVEVEELSFAWSQAGFRLSRYKNLTIKPVINLTGIEDGPIQALIYEGLIAWCEQSGLKLSDDGEISCEGAIVELNNERSFSDKVNVFRGEEIDFFLEAEFIVKEVPSQNILCKVRHGVTASQSDQLAGLLISGLARYFEAHK